ncbi:type I pullulanase [Hymenobacter sp. BT770]|uniref:type I pullulanase n=1 Tax=Hymenobacter sp. BT770 TaxID=2886942 RepID=UPI001D10A376|nr:type I pullulanase [Hymenobacter sp. BT770]MCC3153133.1 type I pullulanase [Hymenobacter sp. BT770]MDO3415393.1 type I pullulanase [Hymenobacter sp. BT770]
MIRPLLLLVLLFAAPTAPAQSLPDYAKYPTYNGPDLGLTWRAGQATLRVWAPTAEALHLRLYAAGTGGAPLAEHLMRKAEGGTWTCTLPAGTIGFYSVQATIKGKAMAEVADPYAHAVGLNGQRGAVLNPATAQPPGWADDLRPALKQPTDIVIGEVHVRDLSMHPQSGIREKGKFLGVAQLGTRGPNGVTTGLDHLVELGLTHVHLLPTNDFASIDEAAPASANRYNWGYDPLNYTVPEGTYATDAADPAVRIRELKQLVGNLHSQGLRVVLDVVYNHTSNAARSAFEQLVPGYYYRHNPDGTLSNATACGNEVASERPMVRKLIVESVAYWAREYHADGFRFDLMGVLDIETMRAVRVALDLQDHSIFVYGEGWTAGPSPLPEARRAVKANMPKLPRIAAFGDELRDGVKGHYARQSEPGFASGQPGLEESVKFGIVAATQHPQLNYAKVNYSKAPWATSPAQAINYVACHDDRVLWDKLTVSNPGASEAELIKMDLLSNTIVFTSQGVPFLPVGDEFLRTKGGSHNSYNQPDSVNQLDWGRKAKYQAVFEFYRRLIALRSAHPAFRLPTTELIQEHLEFLPNLPAGTIAYRLKDHAGGDKWQNIVVLFNGNRTAVNMPIPDGKYTVVLRGDQLNEKGLGKVEQAGAALQLPASSAMILVQ